VGALLVAPQAGARSGGENSGGISQFAGRKSEMAQFSADIDLSGLDGTTGFRPRPASSTATASPA
jgi:hypothetical protein